MPKLPKRHALRGTVRSHNISPRGHVEGALLETSDGTVQINLPKHAEAGARLAIGKKVTLTATLEADDGDHVVYELTEASEGTQGRVVRLNYARHGEVNGYHLHSGVFVHVKPDGARRYKVRVGDTITVEGERRTGPDAVVIEAERVSKRARA